MMMVNMGHAILARPGLSSITPLPHPEAYKGTARLRALPVGELFPVSVSSDFVILSSKYTKPKEYLSMNWNSLMWLRESLRTEPCMD